MSMRRLAAATLLALPGIAGADALADSLSGCRAIDDAGARLACYDRLAGRPAAASTSPLVAPAAARTVDPQSFGAETLPRSRDQRPPDPPKQLHARIRGRLTEWQRGTVIALDNGQSWKVVSDDRGYYPKLPENAEVQISESPLFGSYRLKILANERTLRVIRIQ